jgi:hypothetical protein
VGRHGEPKYRALEFGAYARSTGAGVIVTKPRTAAKLVRSARDDIADACKRVNQLDTRPAPAVPGSIRISRLAYKATESALIFTLRVRQSYGDVS